MMNTAGRPRLSIVIESTTGDISGVCESRRNLLEWIEAAKQASNGSYEIIVAGPQVARGLAEMAAEIPLRALVVPGAGYYALKNAGANAATGEIVFFTDLDCHPGPNAIGALIEAFANPEVACVAGRSMYDGSGLWTRVNSVQSFADLYCGQEHFDRGHMVYSHNVAVRRDALRNDPFGPFNGRIGGDRYLTDAVRSAGHRIVIVPKMIILHEDPTGSLAATVERHLRECFVPLGYGTHQQRYSLLFTLACTLFLRPALRIRRVLRAGARLGIRRSDYGFVVLVNAAYWIFDMACVTAVLLVPRLRKNWLRFQFGHVAG